MSIFARFAGATSKSDAPSPPPTSSQSSEYSDAVKQRELTVELARLLARRPVMHRTGVKKPCCELDETDEDGTDETLTGFEVAAGIESAKPFSLSPPPLPGATGAGTDEATGYTGFEPAYRPESATPPAKDITTQPGQDHARWVATSKRARFKTGVRKAASWMISIVTGIFIFAVVALIVLGPPKDYEKLIDWPTKIVALSSTGATPIPATRTASDLETRSVKIHQFRLSQDKPSGGVFDQGR